MLEARAVINFGTTNIKNRRLKQKASVNDITTISQISLKVAKFRAGVAPFEGLPLKARLV